jgi:hypothetical protein
MIAPFQIDVSASILIVCKELLDTEEFPLLRGTLVRGMLRGSNRTLPNLVCPWR